MITVTMLGSGTSSGVPVIGCRCPTCTSTDRHDQRTRSSIWITSDTTSIVIDTSSDFREQCLREHIDRLDAVVYTHHHYDHISGFDDLRAFNYLLSKRIAVYHTKETYAYLATVFEYAFVHDSSNMSSKPLVESHYFSNEPFTIGDITLQPVDLLHGDMAVKGFRVGAFAYCTDCNYISDSSIDQLQGVDVLIIDGLRESLHPTHYNFEQAIAMSRLIGARQTFLTHIAHDMTHEHINARLPEGIRAGYDGLRIEV